jgi:hypothetical protein
MIDFPFKNSSPVFVLLFSAGYTPGDNRLDGHKKIHTVIMTGCSGRINTARAGKSAAPP